jgi:hypothetical protein
MAAFRRSESDRIVSKQKVMQLTHVNTDYWAALSKDEMQHIDNLMEKNATARVKMNKYMSKKAKPSVALFNSFGFTASLEGAGYWLNVYRKLFKLGL